MGNIVVNDKKGVLGILKNYGNFRKRTPEEFYHLEQTLGYKNPINILLSSFAKKCSMESRNKKVYLQVKNTESK